jgi:hypothetical protein
VRWFRRQGRVLTHQIVSDVGVINHLKDLGEDVEISINRKSVGDARLVIMRLANAGPETVRYTERIRVKFNPPRLIRGAYRGTCPLPVLFNDVSVASSASGNGLNMLANGSIQVADFRAGGAPQSSSTRWPRSSSPSSSTAR